MTVTEAFLGEHAVLYAQFDHLEQALPTIATPAEVHAQAGVLAAGLKSHAQLEEALLFVRLEPALGTGMGPLAVMRAEHDQVEGAVGRVAELDDLDDARNLLRQLINVARQHFAKEEQVLFPMAQRVLGHDELEAIGEQWAQERGVTVAG